MINVKIFNKSGKRPRILVSPLEWGLGHATRCIPVINELLAQECEVLIAAETTVADLLKKEFPDLRFLQLRGYRMTYSRKKIWLPFKLLTQLPKVLYSIYNEHRWLKRIVKEENIDAVISDNRLGLYHKTIFSIYITHQLNIETGNSFLNWLAQKMHYYFINKYAVCWVPDEEGKVNLAGNLSHPKKLPSTALQYLGPLSRFEKMDVEKIYDLLICLSGPEPQRTIFEDMLLNCLVNYKGKVLFVRGLPSKNNTINISNSSVEVLNHLPSAELSKAIQQAKMVISRSGYTTIMDLVKLEQKAILVPTPGQKEQEYLSKILMEKNLFFCVDQAKFSLHKILEGASTFPYTFISTGQTKYKKVINDLASQLKVSLNNSNIYNHE